MTHRLKTLILMLVVCGTFQYGTAHAEVRATDVCPALGGFSPSIASTSAVTDSGRCYSTHPCFVGLRGDWLDTTNTNQIARVSGPTATITFVEKGTERSTHGCIPGANKDREGFIKLRLEGISGTGTLRIKLPRPGGSDTVDVIVRDGSTFLMKTAHTGLRPGVTAERGFIGRNLDKLRIKPSTGASGSQLTLQRSTSAGVSNAQLSTSITALRQPDAILNQTETSATIRLTYNTSGTFPLEDKLAFEGFEGGEPALNRDFGWPTMLVSPPPAPASSSSGNQSGGISITLTGNGGGTVISNPRGINCPSDDCRSSFQANTNVNLTATPNGTSRFIGWGGACLSAATSTTCSITQPTAAASAQFVRVFKLTVKKLGRSVPGSLRPPAPDAGTVTSSTHPSSLAPINCGSQCAAATTDYSDSTARVTLTASPAPGHRFSSWSVTACSNSSTTCTFTIGNSDDKTVEVRFDD